MGEHIVSGLGVRLRELRQQKGLKLIEVAQDAGVSKGLLSKIENGRTIPSLPVLASIVKSLKIGMDEFFAGIKEEDGERFVHIKPAAFKTVKKENAIGFIYEQMLNRTAGDTVLEAVILTIEPGSKRSKVVTDAYELKYVLEGTIEYELDDETIILEKGDCLYYDGRIPHVPHNRTNETARMLVIYLFNNK